jgi:hypothetical protein
MNTFRLLDEIEFWSWFVGMSLFLGVGMGPGRWLCRWHDVRLWGNGLALPCPGCRLMVVKHGSRKP